VSIKGMLSLVYYSKKNNLAVDRGLRKEEVESIIDNLIDMLCLEVLYYIFENVDRTIDNNLIENYLKYDIENKEDIYNKINKLHEDKIERTSLYFMKSDLEIYIVLSKIRMMIIRLDGLRYIKRYRDKVEKIIRYGEINNRINYTIIKEKLLEIFE
jgi:hypothetical protein